MKTILTIILLMIFSSDAFSKLYIRNRYNGGLFGYRSVSSTVSYDGISNEQIITTNCFDPGYSKCRHNREILPGGQENPTAFNGIFNKIDADLGTGMSSGTFVFDNSYYVSWATTTVNGNATDRINIYTLVEARQLGLIN